MSDTNADAARARGAAMRQQRVARARTIRRRIVSGSVALFVAAWLLITIVLVSGHDPALASHSSAATVTSSSGSGTATTSATSSQTSGSSSTTSDSGSSGSGSSSSSNDNASGGTVSSVTTSQS